MTTPLNHLAAAVADLIVAEAERLRVHVRQIAGARVVDLGIQAPGGLEAGRQLALACLSGLADVAFVPVGMGRAGFPAVQVRTDAPLAACMASQYAGWQIAQGKFFAMGSGPMRALARKEELFQKIGFEETSSVAVGILETRKLPTEEIVQYIATACRVNPESLTLLCAPTASQAGTVQVVARSVETALHKLHELGLDLRQVESGYGVAPLPPVARDDLTAIGWTNDAVLYGAQVTLWVRGEDEVLESLAARTPSSASPAYGAPFAEIFERSGRDFYRIDPHLFSPAAVALVNLRTGRTFCAGAVAPEILRRSFA